VKSIVIDASIAATWTLEDEKSETARRILKEVKNLVPITTSLFWHEYRNILVINARRGRIEKDQLPAHLQKIHSLGIKEMMSDNDTHILSLAFQHNLSAYDAAYLALAISADAILATNDRCNPMWNYAAYWRSHTEGRRRLISAGRFSPVPYIMMRSLPA